jgi:hypothetical protein
LSFESWELSQPLLTAPRTQSSTPPTSTDTCIHLVQTRGSLLLVLDPYTAAVSEKKKKKKKNPQHYSFALGTKKKANPCSLAP